jgi:hypothetical protein
VRVLLVNSLYPPADIGGAERSVAQLARGLVDAGVAVSVLTLSAGPDAGVTTEAGVTIHRTTLRHLYWPYDGKRRPAPARAAWHGLEAIGSRMDGAVMRAVEATRPDLIHR